MKQFVTMRVVLLMLGLVLLAAGCGGSAPGSANPEDNNALNGEAAGLASCAGLSLEGALVTLEASDPAPGIDAALWSELTGELNRVLMARGVSKFTTAPPTGESNAIKDLTVSGDGGGGFNLTWTYMNVGDYNQDSMVTINDITPIGQHYQEREGSPSWDDAQLADGNGDGLITINDITQIGQFYLATVSGYNVYGGDSVDGPWTKIGNVAFGTGVVGPSPIGGNRRMFTFYMATNDYAEYRVAPYHGSGEVVSWSGPTPASGELSFDDMGSGITLDVTVLGFTIDGETSEQVVAPFKGAEVVAVVTDDVIAVGARDPSGEYYPVLNVAPRNGTSSLKSGSAGSYEIELLLGEDILTTVDTSLVAGPTLFSDSSLASELNCQMANVQVAADVVAGAGGIIALKYRLANGEWKTIYLRFGDGWLAADVVDALADYLDVSQLYRICQHPLFPWYVEIEVGTIGEASGEIIDAPEGLVIEIEPSGGISGNVATVVFTNNTGAAILVIIIPGTIFINGNGDAQNLVVIDTTVIFIPVDGVRTVAIFGSCANADKDAPDNSDELTPQAELRADLNALCQVIDELKPPDLVALMAVWVITNDSYPMSCEDAVRALFRAAGLNPDDYPGFENPFL
jgi:hypothetical protein